MGLWQGQQVSRPPTIPHFVEASPEMVAIYKYVKEMANVMTAMKNDLEFAINGHLDAKNIRANSIEAKNIKAGTITGNEIAAGAITADKIDVNQLSAIAADLGTIMAGTITTNATINVGTDARIGNVLYLNETDGTSQKGIVFSDALSDSVSLEALQGDLEIRVDGFITFTIGSPFGLVVNKKVVAPTFSATVRMDINGETVATVTELLTGLAGKADIFSGYTGSFISGSQTVNVSNGIITSVV
ncbi:hypothetical protein [Paenibacillus koleovorans]|uniref:hypothetical protein n=1 Tax=Paenibacillus koleovorans TaxID=121608 RepID=UPI000FDA00A5|nr:hypothetical protein [Paenibacillus koleovorans]